MQVNTMVSQLAGGMLVSTEIFVVTLLFSLPLGLLIAFGRMSKNKILQGIVKTYISIMRGTPLMLQLMVVYFGPYYLFGIKIKSNNYRLIAAMIGFVINYAAYFAEIYRSGIQSMPAGQYEAARLQPQPDFFPYHPAAGDQTDLTVRDQRGHYPGQGYISGIYHQRSGDVCYCESTGIFPDQHDPVCGSRCILLCL